MFMPSQDPLTDDELEELERFLLDAEGIDESMDISMLDGFFAAILSGPKTILPSEWMRSVWDTEKGEDSPVFSGVDQAQRILGLLMRHMNAVATTLLEAPGDYEPLLMENTRDGDPVPVIDEWCMGYMKGVSLDLQGWLPITIGHPDWLSTIMLYGTEEGWEQLKKKDLSIEEHRRLAAGLGDTARKVHAHFLEQRKAEAAMGVAPAAVRREPIRNTGKVGRNDPCPCGSGKKYKSCHGSTTQLH
jgi:uncharacterized protein